MQIVCPGCNKRLNISESLTRKTVRCPGCKTVLTLPDRGQPPPTDVTDAEPPDAPTGPIIPLMRCAKCKAAVLRRLPPDNLTRNPGYVCSACGAEMRAPGTGAFYIFCIGFGAVFALLCLFLCVAIILALTENVVVLVCSTLFFAAVGGLVSIWGVTQLMLPEPLDAPKRRSRVLKAVGIFLGVVVVLVLLLGGCAFGVLYWMHEKM